MTMRSAELRKKFLAFFRSKEHTVVPSDSLIPAGDPTLLFTGAGMNQFKDYFLGMKKDMRRAASSQKCFRTSDVEQVGHTPSHLTFFEMLGNFSFGDYFKEGAISYAWEFLMKEMKINPDRLWASIYEEDEEAASLWKKVAGLDPKRIVRFGAKDNFWPSDAPRTGPNGPCGPCSEIYFDYQRCLVGRICPDPDRCQPGCSCGRFVEIWNLVFTQFDRKDVNKLTPLPAKNIDTGMGLERITAVMQDKMSVFETDLFEPTLEEIVRLLRTEAPDLFALDQRASAHAIADHVRALTFLIADGVVPSNDGRGYVLRMLLRKAARAGRGLGLTKPFLYTLVPSVVKTVEEAYPELVSRRESIAKAILSEEERFQQTLEEKIPLLREAIKALRGQTPGGLTPTGLFAADAAARFYDTHGISFEEIVEACRQEKVQPPRREDFEKALAALQAKSKASSAFTGEIFAKDKLVELVSKVTQATDFVGYKELTAKARVLGLIQEDHLVEKAQAPAKLGVILDRSPFYGEAGGQVGDTGTLQGPEGKLKVIDTQRVGGIFFHQAEFLEGRIRVSDPVTATVDADRRRKVAQNHTATHLLHAGLRKVLGPHVAQAGSLVAPDRLRFDFSHAQAVPRVQLESVEHLVNGWIESDLSVSAAQTSLEEARKSGALALFGEKYGSTVRVVSIGDVSKELCGGTHLNASGEVGLLRIVEERSVAAGVRRLEALTDQQAHAFIKLEEALLIQEKERSLKRAQEKEEEGKLFRQKVKEGRMQAEQARKEKIGPFSFFELKFDQSMGHAALRSSADAIRSCEPEAIVLLADSEGFCVATSGGTAQRKGIRADALLKLATQIAGGSGGGRPDLAQGKIQSPWKFPQVAGRLKQFIQEHV